MSLDDALGSVLRQVAEQPRAPEPDVDALQAGGRARQRRRRARHVALGAVVAAVVVFSVFAFDLGRGDPGGSGERVTPTPRPGAGQSAAIPYCVAGAGRDGKDVLRGVGEDIETYCTFRPSPQAGRHSYLWHHADRTLLATPDGVLQVDGRGLVELGGESARTVRMSHDGGLAAWIVESGSAGSGPLVVHDLATGEEVARAAVPSTWSRIAGIDDLDRVFVMSEGRRVEDPGDDLVLMYDLSSGTWSSVRGLPPAPRRSAISYLTADGLAVQVGEDPGGRSIEGRVTRDGRFQRLRDVPMGQAVWSLDRSHVLHEAEDGFRISFADFSVHTRLDLRRPAGLVWWDAQWETHDTVLITLVGVIDGASDPDDAQTVRCSVAGGECDEVLRVVVPWSNQARPAG